MEVSYLMTLDDLVAFNLRVAEKTRGASYYFLWAVVPLANVALALVAPYYGWSGLSRFSFLLTAGILLFAFPSIYRWLVAMNVRHFVSRLGTKGIVGMYRLMLDDEALTEFTDASTSRAPWIGIVGLEEMADRTYIYITGLSAAIVPRRGFSSDDEYRRFVQFARDHIAQHVPPADASTTQG